jgi:monofunctional biosynthetic peptidoglycan transglycosylase
MDKRNFLLTLGKWFQRLLMLAWLAIVGILLSYSYPFFNSMHGITKIPNTYFKINYSKETGVSYLQVEVPPSDWVPLDEISKRLQGAIISSEDGKFYQHPGYDVEELTDAIDKGLVKKRKKKKIRGASTITQQLVKNLYFQSDRSFWRKTKEMALTLWIEDHVDKGKILETYLNVIEYGDGIYGIKHAAKHYFKKAPKNLTARESAFLAMLLPSPKRYAVSFSKRILTPFAQKSIHSILFKMLQGGYIGSQEYTNNLSTPFSWEKYEQATFESDGIGDL